ncbi:MAG: enoyl-CoA hydratase/isomerase family protein [Rhodospirillaceae bacterium]|nr:enoyl-CoA hydratase/isomerase family protein [Rhodospirillaceae bacterium]
MSKVHLNIRDRVAELRIDNPAKLNAMTAEMLRQLKRHLEAVEGNADVACMVISGEGDRAFCSGADISGWGELSPAQFARHWIREGHRTFDRLARLSKPTVAVVNGMALGGGLELAAACDLRVMARTAEIALPEAAVGVVPGWSGTQRLARLIPEPVLKEMALFGRRLSAERALELGFVAELADDPHSAARAMVDRVARLSPRSVETAKWMIHAARDEDRDAMIDALGGAAVSAAADRSEGVAAFRDKRPPDFPGT